MKYLQFLHTNQEKQNDFQWDQSVWFPFLESVQLSTGENRDLKSYLLGFHGHFPHDNPLQNQDLQKNRQSNMILRYNFHRLFL